MFSSAYDLMKLWNGPKQSHAPQLDRDRPTETHQPPDAAAGSRITNLTQIVRLQHLQTTILYPWRIEASCMAFNARTGKYGQQ
jgi:hypothetical protein